MPREEYQRVLTAGDDRRTQIALQHQTFDSFLSYSFPPQFLCHTCSHILFSSSSHVDRVSSIIHNQSTLEKKDRLLFFFSFLRFFSYSSLAYVSIRIRCGLQPACRDSFPGRVIFFLFSFFHLVMLFSLHFFFLSYSSRLF